ncbi:MAG TPA: aconitate hydratase [Phycisphaerae bacterium]|nr:aconitate hydratase [Phycisphaerae bacterium]
MAETMVHKILREHLIEGELVAGREIGVRIDQCLTQDATGTTAFLLFEAMQIPRVRCELAVSYVDHNMSQFGPENHNDHLYLQSVATKVGAYHSRPGNGICHQVHLERFGQPGKTLLGSDSHTPTNGGIGMLAIGAGGLDVAVAMGGGPFYMTCPRVIGVELTGRLQPWVASKDIIFRLLSILTTKGNVGCVVEYHGEGVGCLNVPARSTCTNMGAELGVTTSVFPSDDLTRRFMEAQQRADQWQALAPDPDARYDRITKMLHGARDAAVIDNIRTYCAGVEVSKPDKNGFVEVGFDKIVIDLGKLEPLCATPGSPDNITTVGQHAGKEVDQVLVGSCTNSSYQDLMLCAEAMKGRTVHPKVEMGVSPGSRQVFTMIGRNGALADFIAAGARILESACGPCIGQGQSPGQDRVSLRSFNRNFDGRSGTKNDTVYLVSPETAVASAITGVFTDPRDLTEQLGIAYRQVEWPEKFEVDDSMVLPPVPADRADKAEVIRAPTIVTPPGGQPVPEDLAGKILIKVGEKITTDHIMPAGAFLKFRSNVPEYAKAVFHPLNEPDRPTFHERASSLRDAGGHGVIVAGDSYGQGSSREHAALCPMYLGVKAVIAKAIERIHKANLINFAIVPLLLGDVADYDRLEEGDELRIPALAAAVRDGAETVTVTDVSRGFDFVCRLDLSERDRRTLSAGGKLLLTGQNSG